MNGKHVLALRETRRKRAEMGNPMSLEEFIEALFTALCADAARDAGKGKP